MTVCAQTLTSICNCFSVSTVSRDFISASSWSFLFIFYFLKAHVIHNFLVSPEFLALPQKL